MEDLRTQLDQLENMQLVRRLPDEELTYLFKHALTQDTVYASLLLRTRRELRRLQAETRKELDALMPSILAKAFAGQLVP